MFTLENLARKGLTYYGVVNPYDMTSHGNYCCR